MNFGGIVCLFNLFYLIEASVRIPKKKLTASENESKKLCEFVVAEEIDSKQTMIFLLGKIDEKLEKIESKIDGKIEKLEKKINCKIEKLAKKIDAITEVMSKIMAKMDRKFEDSAKKIDFTDTSVLSFRKYILGCIIAYPFLFALISFVLKARYSYYPSLKT